MEKIFEILYNNEKKDKNTVVVVGDAILDKYIYGTLNNEDIPIFTPGKKFLYLGGAANVAHNVMKMENDYMFFSIIGDGDNSRNLLTIFNGKGLESNYIIKETSRDISLKTRIVSDKQVIVRIDEDVIEDSNLMANGYLFNRLKHLIKDTKVLIISNYYKGCISEDLYIKIKNLCIENNIKLLLDCSRKHDFSGVYLLKPNLVEFANITNKQFNNMKDIIETGINFKNVNNIQNLLVTMDKDGLIFIDSDDNYHHIKSISNQAIDACGAGDSLIAGIATCLARDIDLKTSIEFGNMAASVCCSNIGTYAVTLDDIKTLWNKIA